MWPLREEDQGPGSGAHVLFRFALLRQPQEPEGEPKLGVGEDPTQVGAPGTIHGAPRTSQEPILQRHPHMSVISIRCLSMEMCA